MRVVIQRVSHASVGIVAEDGTNAIQEKRSIGQGLLVLLGVCEEDQAEDVEWLVKKIANLRVFDDENGVMNRSVIDIGGEALVVSQFTLYADCRRGNRLSFTDAARPDLAIPLYERFCDNAVRDGFSVDRGVFGADMQVSLVNDGPFTVMVEV